MRPRRWRHGGVASPRRRRRDLKFGRVRKQTLTHHVASNGLAQTGQCQKMLEGPWGGAMGSSKEQKLPQPGQGAERKTSGAWHLLHAQKNSKLSRNSFLLSDVHRTQGTPIYENDSVSPAGICRMDVTSMLPSLVERKRQLGAQSCRSADTVS